MKIITTFRNHLIIIIFAVTTVSPYPADGKSVKEMFAEVSSSIVVVLTLDAGGRKTGQGSGVVVGKNEVVTNCHVVSNARTIAVRQAADVRGRETYRMEAELVARNEQRDLCLLSVKELSVPPAAPPVTFAAARSVSIGEEVYAIGAPQGLDLSLSRGIISQLRGNYGKQSAPIIQTDAAISPGSSGGGLFNENGELLGITTFKFSGGASEGLSFALPVEWVKELMMHAGVKIAAGRERKRCFSYPTIACLLTQALEAVEVGKIDATDYISTLVEIATAQAKTGDKIGARKTLAKAMQQTAREIPLLDLLRDSFLYEIAKAQAEIGDIAEAMQIAGTIDEVGFLSRAFRDIARVQADMGDKLGAKEILTVAIQTVERINNVASRAGALSGIARVQADMGDKLGAKETLTEAIETAGRSNEVRSRAVALSQIAAAQADMGDEIGARETFAETMHAAWRINNAGSCYSFAPHRQAQADMGDEIGARKTLAEAMQTAREISSLEGIPLRAWAFRDIARAQAEIGDIAKAMQIAGTIDEVGSRSGALSGIAVAQAEIGDIKGAMNTASKITENDDLAVALARIAVALSRIK